MTEAGAGILPGSAVPQTGNTFNQIEVPTFLLAQQRAWANTGLPYVVLGGFPQIYGGSLTVEPGTNIKFGPGAGAFLISGAWWIFRARPRNRSCSNHCNPARVAGSASSGLTISTPRRGTQSSMEARSPCSPMAE